jgi:alpha-beta hydrolase superfamily lysophospholipase
MKTFCFLVGFLLTTTTFAIDPERTYNRTPRSINAKFDSLFVNTKDNLSIYTWIYYPSPEKDNNKVIVLASTDKGNMGNWVFFAGVFLENGFTVVTFDYRGFGKSSDFSINKNNLYYIEFSNDLVAVVKKTKAMFPNKHIGVWALSMGSMVLVKSLNQINGDLDFVILDGFITNIERVSKRIWNQKKNRVVLPESNRSYNQSLQKLTLPALIFAASKDQITTAQDARDFERSSIGKNVQVVVYEGEHLRGFQAGDGPFGEFYLNKINSFLQGQL